MMESVSFKVDTDQIYPDLIRCPRQPGNLKISRHACALRYIKANKENTRFANDEFGMARKAGFDICKNCPEGKKNAKRLRYK